MYTVSLFIEYYCIATRPASRHSARNQKKKKNEILYVPIVWYFFRCYNIIWHKPRFEKVYLRICDYTNKDRLLNLKIHSENRSWLTTKLRQRSNHTIDMLGTDKGAIQTVSSTQPHLHQPCSSRASRFKTVAKTNVYLVVSGDEKLISQRLS